MSRSRGYWIASIVLVLLVAGVSVWLYPSLPERIPTHWNIKGQIDGYGSKHWAVFLMPVFMVALLVFFYFLPALSPKHFEVDAFRPTYLYIMVVLTALFAYLHLLTLYAVWKSVAQHEQFDLGRPLVAGIFLMYALMGNVLGKVRKNFYIGVRVPWTLASDRVWNDTHRVAAWIMVSAGLLGFIMTLAGVPFLYSIALFIVSAFVPIIYSFVHYKALERRGAL
ncbi:MAG: SdpI family protein [Isosphaeraceae bacterium]